MGKQIIYFQGGNGDMSPMVESEYDSEDFFQRLLADNPDLLAGGVGQYDETRRWLLIAREAAIPDSESSTGRWSLDHFFIDQDAIPTLVEVKRRSDTRIRREVVGQMFDYAANAANFWTAQTLESYFEKTCSDTGIASDQALMEFFGDEEDTEDIWGKVYKNLRANRLKLVFVADELPSELVRIIEFMNEVMPDIDVLGIVVKQYIGEGGRAYVPQVVGYSATKAAQKLDAISGPALEWDAERYRRKLKTSGIDGLVDLSDRLLTWAESKSTLPVWWGRGRQDGCFAAALKIDEENVWLVYFRTGEKGTGYVQLSFANLSKHKSFTSEDARLRLLEKLNASLGVSIPEDKINVWPSFPLSVLLDKEKYEAFLSILNNLDKFK